MSSSWPVTVTVCGVSQFAVVNVSVPSAGSVTRPSVASFDATSTVTLAVGSESSTTVNVAVAPDSDVLLLIVLTVIVLPCRRCRW